MLLIIEIMLYRRQQSVERFRYSQLLKAVRKNIAIDWTVRESARAKIRVIVKRILKKYGYPPDRQAEATKLVLEQAAVMCNEWVAC